MLVLVLVIALCGCANLRWGYEPTDVETAFDAGKFAVYAAHRFDLVERRELEAARPYLEYVVTVLEAEPADAPVALLAVLDAEAARWAALLPESDRALILDALGTFLQRIKVQGKHTLEEARAAALAASAVRGMIKGIDIILQ